MTYREDFKAVQRETVWTFWRIFPLAILAFLIIGGTATILTIASRPAQIITRVTDPDRVIQNYEWFEESYNDMLALDGQIENSQRQVDDFIAIAGAREDWSRSDKIEYSRLNAIVLGLRNQRENVVAQYNAKSNLITRNLFKGSALPYQLTIQNDTTSEVWVK